MDVEGGAASQRKTWRRRFMDVVKKDVMVVGVTVWRQMIHCGDLPELEKINKYSGCPGTVFYDNGLLQLSEQYEYFHLSTGWYHVLIPCTFKVESQKK